MRKTVDAAGKAIHFQKSWAPVDEVITLIGEYGPSDEISWRLGKPLKIAPETSSRGLDELLAGDWTVWPSTIEKKRTINAEAKMDFFTRQPKIFMRY